MEKISPLIPCTYQVPLVISNSKERNTHFDTSTHFEFDAEIENIELRTPRR